MNINTMTDKQVADALAEACGWTERTPRVVMDAIFPVRLPDRAGRPIRGTTLKLVALAVWASFGEMTHVRDLAARAGCSVSQAWRALDVLEDLGLVRCQRHRRDGVTRYSPRCRCWINMRAVVAMVSGAWSPARDGTWREPSLDRSA